MPKERLDLIKSLKGDLDSLVPTIKDKMKKNPNYRKDAKVNAALDDLRAAEAKVEHELIKDRYMIDVKDRGDAAVYERSRINPSLPLDKKTVLSPEHLRYLARQLKLLLTLRKVEPMDHMNTFDEEIGTGSEEVAEINRTYKAYNRTDTDLIDRDQARKDRKDPKKTTKMFKDKKASMKEQTDQDAEQDTEELAEIAEELSIESPYMARFHIDE
jgi:hypothetical protein